MIKPLSSRLALIIVTIGINFMQEEDLIYYLLIMSLSCTGWRMADMFIIINTPGKLVIRLGKMKMMG
jgi:hypothetical protein